MPYIPQAGAVTKALAGIQDRLRPHISAEVMRQLDEDLTKCFSEIRIHIQSAIYQQIANLIDEGKLSDS